MFYLIDSREIEILHSRIYQKVLKNMQLLSERSEYVRNIYFTYKHEWQSWNCYLNEECLTISLKLSFAKMVFPLFVVFLRLKEIKFMYLFEAQILSLICGYRIGQYPLSNEACVTEQ